jgi:hypothetical protein
MIDLGLFLVIIASVITLYGVHSFNQSLDPDRARHVWALSNPIFSLYFIGRVAGWWDGGLSDAVMAGIYFYMTGSNFLSLYRESKNKKSDVKK